MLLSFLRAKCPPDPVGPRSLTPSFLTKKSTLQKNLKKIENIPKIEPKYLQKWVKNGTKNRFYWFLPNLDFVQHYNGFAWFLRFGGASGRLKIDKKNDLENRTLKNTFFSQKVPKMFYKRSRISAPKWFIFGTFSVWAPERAPKRQKASPGDPKVLKNMRKGCPRVLKTTPKPSRKLKKTMPRELFFIYPKALRANPPPC